MNKEMQGRADKVSFLPEDTMKERLRKAAHVKPGQEILNWMKKEMTAFIHFGPNTFNERQWGNGKEQPENYCPTALDVEQWVQVCRDAGLKHIILTIKHHDGFCLWNTETTDFSVSQAPDKTDVAYELSQACHKYGVGFGVYLSPWDMHQRESGLWNTPAYNDYFKKQLTELLTKYGAVDEVWFDGACGDYLIWKQVPCYKPDEWYEIIHRLQPNAVYRMYDPYFFASEEAWGDLQKGNGSIKWSGKAVRWVGNEEGRSRTDEWSVQPVFDRAIAQSATYQDLGQDSYYANAVGAVWYPVEVNTTILNQWFWNEKTSRIKSLDRLIETYYQSVGNNGVLLLNLSPDKHGRIPDDQIRRLKELTAYIHDTFSHNLAQGAFPKEWTVKEKWDIDNSRAELEITLPEICEFDQVMVQEKIEEGQRVAEWSFDVWMEDGWREMVHKGTIGYKCIRRFPRVKSGRVRLRILRSYDTPIISGFGLYLSYFSMQMQKQEDVIKGIRPLSTLRDRKGLRYKLYKGGQQSAAEIREASSQRMEAEGECEALSLSIVPYETDYSIEYTGLLHVEKTGCYTIEMESTDGAVLWIGDVPCLMNDEPHELRNVSCRVELECGYYSFSLYYTSFRHKGVLHIDWDVESASRKLITILGEYNGF